MRNIKDKVFLIVIIAAILLGCSNDNNNQYGYSKEDVSEKYTNIEEYIHSYDNIFIGDTNIPWYSGNPYIEINDNKPDFRQNDQIEESFENYSELDDFGRCGVAYACVGKDLMPTEERESIGQIRPSGWHTVKYDFVDGKYLYNRCHLIGYQLSGENANKKNLITGTRYMNVEGMLPFENMVADYIEKTNNHVLYRVTPIFILDNMLASGVHMEAFSVEDNGSGVCFNIFVYNVQPGIDIDYVSGESWEESGNSGINDRVKQNEYTEEEIGTQDYILNTNTMKFHNPNCRSVSKMNDTNKESFNGPRQWLIDNGYEPCGTCKP